MKEERLFCCPVCRGSLNREGTACSCENGHSFDVARQGYVHLLLPNKMHSKLPGDSREMVEGRRAFLEAGYYRPFQKELVRLCRKYCPARGAPVILDAGCGEGYYTGAVQEALPHARVCGFDISKLAVKAAAGKYKGIELAVASSFGIPMKDESCDVLLDVFSPLVPEEFARVLKPGGVMLLAVPGERHLFGMKEILYEEPYENEHRDTEYSGFRFLERGSIRGKITIPDGETAGRLFAMTPYYWKTGVEGSGRLRETKGFETEIAFDFIAYRRLGEGKSDPLQ